MISSHLVALMRWSYSSRVRCVCYRPILYFWSLSKIIFWFIVRVNDHGCVCNISVRKGLRNVVDPVAVLGKNIWGPGPSSFGRQQRLSEIQVDISHIQIRTDAAENSRMENDIKWVSQNSYRLTTTSVACLCNYSLVDGSSAEINGSGVGVALKKSDWQQMGGMAGEGAENGRMKT